MDNGYNPIRWQCKSNGCYLTECHPKIEIFAECFTGKIAFSDIDAITEINNKFLLMEWKGIGGQVTGGQERMFRSLMQRDDFTVFLVYGDSKTMEVFYYLRYHKNHVYKRRNGTLETLKQQFKIWERWARNDLQEWN